jgi:hypothetical protein
MAQGPQISTFWHKVPSSAFAGTPRQARAIGAGSLRGHDILVYGGRTANAQISLGTAQQLHLPDGRFSNIEMHGLGEASRVGASMWRFEQSKFQVLIGNDAVDPLSLMPKPRPGSLDVYVLPDGRSVWEHVALTRPTETTPIPCSRVGCTTVSDGTKRVFFFSGVGPDGVLIHDFGYVTWKSSTNPTVATIRVFTPESADIDGVWPEPRAFATMCFVKYGSLKKRNGDVKALIVAGGVCATGVSRDLHVLSLNNATLSWSKPQLVSPSVPLLPRSHHCSMLVSGVADSSSSPGAECVSIILFGGRDKDANLLAVEAANFSTDLATFSVSHHSAGLGRVMGVQLNQIADTWHAESLLGDSAPPHRWGMQCVSLQPDQLMDASLFATLLRDAMSRAAMAYSTKRARGAGGVASGAVIGGGDAWVDDALAASTVSLIFGGARSEAASRGRAAGAEGVSSVVVFDDVFLLQAVPTSVIPLRVLEGLEAAARSGRPSRAGEVAGVIAGSKRSASSVAAADLPDVEHVPAVTARSRVAIAGAGATSSAFGPQQQLQPPSSYLPAAPVMSLGPVSSEAQQIVQHLVAAMPHILQQLLPSAAPPLYSHPPAVVADSGSLAGIHEQLTRTSGRIEAILSTVQGAATTADNRHPALKADLTHVSDTLMQRLSELTREMGGLTRHVEGHASASKDCDKAIVTMLQQIQNSIISLVTSRDAAAKQQQSEIADSLRANCEKLSNEVAAARALYDASQRSLTKVTEQLDQVQADLSRERAKNAAAEVVAAQAERDRRAAVDQAAAATTEAAKAREALQRERDDRKALTERLRRVEEALK